MAFISFDHVPHDGPTVVRDTVAKIAPVRARERPNFTPHLLRSIRWMVTLGVLALIGVRVAASFESPSLGIVAAGLAFLIGVALTSVTREGPQRR